MYEENLLYKATWYYYVDNMTQKEIAEQLGISRMRVVKLLSRAKDEGIVQFKINRNAEVRVGLEDALRNRFHLKDVFIVPSTKENINDNIAKGAAQYLEDKIEEDALINFGYGDTISRTINHLIYTSDKPISLVTLSGGVSYYTNSIKLGTHSRPTSSVMPAFHVLPAPLLASTREVADILMNEKSVKNILEMTKVSTMSIVGIGAVTNSATIFKYNIVNDNDLTLLKMQGAVGDILSQFYDKDGKIIESEIHNKLVSVTLDSLRDSQETIGVAGGQEKLQAIYSALVGGYLNILITDEDTAQGLLELDKQ